MRRYYLLASLALGAAIAFACTTDTAIGPDVALDSLYIEPDSDVIVLGDTLRLTAVGVDTAGRRFVETRVTWSTSGGAITLAPNGVAVGVATGTASVRATSGGIMATASVTVTPQP